MVIIEKLRRSLYLSENLKRLYPGKICYFLYGEGKNYINVNNEMIIFVSKHEWEKNDFKFEHQQNQLLNIHDKIKKYFQMLKMK